MTPPVERATLVAAARGRHCVIGGAARASDPRWRIVVIDDNPDDRADIRRMLLQGSQRRYEFIEAGTGAAGVRAVLDGPGGPPHCVLLDHRLPDCEAPEVLAALPGLDGARICPVVVVTGSDGPELGRTVLRAGAQDYIGKAWMTAESLTRTVENAVERWTLAGELRASEVHLRLALAASRTGIWSWELGTDAVAWSRECHEIHGVPVGGFAGTVAAFFQIVHPDDRAMVEASVRAAIAEHALYQLEFRVVRPSGEVVWVQGLGRATEPTRMLGTITDISQRKRIEQALQAREREVRTIADNTPDIIARFDRQLRHVFVNAAVEHATGRSPAEFVGKTNRELGMPATLCDRWDEALQAVFARGQPVSIEFAYPAPHQIRHYSNRMVAELGPDGETEFVLVVAHEVTERKLAEDALRSALGEAQQAVLARDQLVSLVSHDLKNPLHTLMMGMQVLGRRMLDGGGELLQRMGRQARRMDKMIDELLDVAQLRAGEPLALELGATDLASLVRGAVDEHSQAAPLHRISVVVAVEAVVGMWDGKRIERVVDNLLSNAIKYSPTGGAVRVDLDLESEEGAAWAVLRVADEGIGIAEADLSRVFQWFSRGENARRLTIQGTGIGLAGVRDIVAQHRGTISVDSREGRGSTFTVRLPLMC